MFTTDGIQPSLSRRGFLQVGSLALGGLALSDILRLQAASAAPGAPRPKSVIMIHLSGGPSHLDTYDLKPQAPVEYRGEFSPIPTNVPGIEICELMPMQAQIADKFTIIRSAQLTPLHTGNEFYSGYPWQATPRVSVPGEATRPAFGSIVSRLRPGSGAVPSYVSIENQTDWERAYYAGVEHEPFRVGGGSSREAVENMGRHRDVSVVRLEDRSQLLQSLDSLRSDLDRSGAARGVEGFRAQALDIVLSATARDAFDLDKEPHESRARYGEDTKFRFGPHPGKSLLLARRLVEAGVSVVTVCVHNWDTHANNFSTLREIVPRLDRALHALVTDLSDRGLLQDVAIVMGGEFGRTPRIGDQTPDGRSHWPDAGFLWLAGGGLKTGQVIGATDARGEKIIGNPVRMQSVLATLYRLLGVDPSVALPDHNGRPQYVLENREPVAGLL